MNGFFRLHGADAPKTATQDNKMEKKKNNIAYGCYANRFSYHEFYKKEKEEQA